MIGIFTAESADHVLRFPYRTLGSRANDQPNRTTLTTIRLRHRRASKASLQGESQAGKIHLNEMDMFSTSNT